MKTLENAYALLIGVGADLKASITDATAIYDVLADQKLCGYKEENIFLLTEEKASKIGIFESLDQLIKVTDEESTILIFYSGHGGFHDGEEEDIYFLQPNDFTATNYIDARDFRDKIGQIKSKRLVLLMDCCHAAGMTRKNNETFQSGNSEANFRENPEGLAQNIEIDQRNITIMSSCREDQLSWIMDGDDNSLFTKCLLEALKAKHKRFFDDEYVRITDAVNYIFKKVPQRQPKQNPYMNLQLYDDFALSYIPEKLRADIEPITIKADNEPNMPSPPKASKNKPEEPPKLVKSYRETENSNNLILFIHGFSGESTDTFGKTPDLLIQENKMDGWDLKPIGYSPQIKPELGKDIWAASVDIEKIASYLVTCIKYKFKKYKNIAIVAHSLGGLVAQRALLNLKTEHSEKISHLILLGTPSMGISNEAIKKVWNEKYTELSSQGEFITKLRAGWNKRFGKNPPFTFKVVAALDDQYVDATSCFADFNEDFCEMVEGNHLDMVKSTDQDDICYNLILHTLTDNDFSNNATNQEDISLALGKYESVVKTLLPKKEHLNVNELRQLVFALEGSGKREKAITLLSNHPLAKKNSDLQGILGGRHKRAYLQSYDKKDASNALKYYKRGLEMAKEANNNDQVYYHAINIAFLLSVAYENNRSEIMEYACEARDAAEATSDSVWKFATLGEAYIYIHAFKDAMTWYEKAAKLANVRQKISIHTNAYIGYVSWMKKIKSSFKVEENDTFIRFLKQRFLN